MIERPKRSVLRGPGRFAAEPRQAQRGEAALQEFSLAKTQLATGAESKMRNHDFESFVLNFFLESKRER
jgi:hypothetical protein